MKKEYITPVIFCCELEFDSDVLAVLAASIVISNEEYGGEFDAKGRYDDGDEDLW